MPSRDSLASDFKALVPSVSPANMHRVPGNWGKVGQPLALDARVAVSFDILTSS